VDEIGTILPALFRKQIGRAEPNMLGILVSLWPRIAGRMMAEHSQPARFDSGVLTLAADCATWGTQLQHMTEDIRAGINRYLGQPLVKKLRVKTMTCPSLFSPPQPLRKTALPVPPAADMDVKSIADREVASALANSYAKYFSRPRR
jgi:predicted nucleic acid-binding Zn ribbon protein